MPDFRFYHPIEVRYGDLDPQGHVNNARYLTYMEQARVAYFRQLGLWKEESWLDIGFILAEARVTFIRPILFGWPLRVGARVSRLGNKSMTMDYRLEDKRDSVELATGSAVLVAYDYRTSTTLPIPDHWRERIDRFEELGSRGDGEMGRNSPPPLCPFADSLTR